MALTQTERDRIVSLRLDNVSLRDVSAETGHALQTVSNVWHLYVAETQQDRRPDLGLRREELLQRFEKNAADARAGVKDAQGAGDHGAAVRYLAAELAALRRVVELDGLAGSTSRFSGGAGTADNPLPWKSPEEALGTRVAVLERSSRESAAINDLLTDDFVAMACANLPTVAELAPVAAENLSDT